MMLIAYLLGQRQFPIPYPVRRIALYLGAMLLAFLLHWVISLITDSLVIRVASGGVLFGLFLLFLLRLERRELTGMPLIGKYIGRYLP
jgi:hypothetical protein